MHTDFSEEQNNGLFNTDSQERIHNLTFKWLNRGALNGYFVKMSDFRFDIIKM